MLQCGSLSERSALLRAAVRPRHAVIHLHIDLLYAYTLFLSELSCYELGSKVYDDYYYEQHDRCRESFIHVKALGLLDIHVYRKRS